MSKRPMVRSRVRSMLDFGRIAEGLARPGIDTRTWVCFARIDTDPDAIVWDEELGWYADATIVEGGLTGEPVLCRVGSDGQGSGLGRYSPPRAGGLVLLAVPGGDPNDECVVLRQFNAYEELAPTTINGDTIVERDPQAGQVAALETHLAVFPNEDADEQWRKRRVATSGAHKLHGDTMELGIAGADQAFARGNDLADALEDVINGIGLFCQTLSAAPAAPPNGALTVASVLTAYNVLSPKITAFANARAQYLSTRIKGD